VNGIKSLASILSRGWWLLLLRGVAALAFGILTFVLPQISLATLVLLFGAYSMADGILCLWSALAGSREHESWWLLLLGGLVGIGIGVLTFMAPGVTALALLIYVAAWAIATGVLEIVAAIRLRIEIQGEWTLILAGLASVVFGVLIMARPGVGALALVWLIGSYACVYGALLLMLAFRARGFVEKIGKAAHA
jgi:uncharacterized membrane protein HdeD (DUF308 family)